jgi:hypothetical protein
MSRSKTNKNIQSATNETQKLLDIEFAKCNNKPEPGSALDQQGLRDGKHIVDDYIAAGEAELALEHLLYMIEETEINVSEDSRVRIRKAAHVLQMSVKI